MKLDFHFELTAADGSTHAATFATIDAVLADLQAKHGDEPVRVRAIEGPVHISEPVKVILKEMEAAN